MLFELCQRIIRFPWEPICIIAIAPHVQVVSETMIQVSGVPGWQLDLVGGARRGGGPGHDVDVLISHPTHPAFAERCCTLPTAHPTFVGRCSFSDSPSSSAGPGVRATQALVASSSPQAASGGQDATSGASDSRIRLQGHQSMMPEALDQAAGSQEGRAAEVPLVEALFEELVASGVHLEWAFGTCMFGRVPECTTTACLSNIKYYFEMPNPVVLQWSFCRSHAATR